MPGSCGYVAEAHASARLREATNEDMPWIGFTIASMVMSPFGLSSKNFLVAEDSGPDAERVGFGQLRPLADAEDSPMLLASLYVSPERRGKGVGSQLVRALLDRFPARQIYALTLRNKLGFFHRLQFREISGEELKTLPDLLALEAQLGRFIAPVAAGQPLVVLRLLLRHLERLDGLAEELRAHQPPDITEVQDLNQELSGWLTCADQFAQGQVASSENGVTTRRWLLSVANAGSQVARANAKLLQKKVETRLQKSEKSTRPASSKNPKVLQSILSEAECLKQQVGSTVALDASSVGRQLVQLLEAADLSSIFASCHQDIPVTPSTPQPFMMAALQEQSFRRVAEAAEQQRPRVQTLCRYLSIPKTLTLAPDAQQVQLRCKSSASQAALQALTPLRLSLETASQELKAALAPKQAAGSGGRSLAARLQSRPSLKELETSLDRLEAGLRTARRALKGRSEKKPKRGKERKEAQQEPEASPPLPVQAAQIAPAQAAKTVHTPPKVSTSKATPRTVVINCANVGTVYSESRALTSIRARWVSKSEKCTEMQQAQKVSAHSDSEGAKEIQKNRTYRSGVDDPRILGTRWISDGQKAQQEYCRQQEMAARNISAPTTRKNGKKKRRPKEPEPLEEGSAVHWAMMRVMGRASAAVVADAPDAAAALVADTVEADTANVADAASVAADARDFADAVVADNANATDAAPDAADAVAADTVVADTASAADAVPNAADAEVADTVVADTANAADAVPDAAAALVADTVEADTANVADMQPPLWRMRGISQMLWWRTMPMPQMQRLMPQMLWWRTPWWRTLPLPQMQCPMPQILWWRTLLMLQIQRQSWRMPRLR
ncbi:unnamed protein product [Effrenium voratum]|uniref:N-acetyltransferase domain-containing protein n=1 Tax=Effrenium voratum TaxID=2562239 RepID=A0AA36N892_9DINO|nr:unnamed protein product [Effrenium voratum]